MGIWGLQINLKRSGGRDYNNLKMSGISSCINGRNHTCGGYIWKTI